MKKYLSIALLIFMATQLTACGFEIVDTGHRGVKRVLKKVEGEPLGEGLHFYNPFTTSITEVSIRETNYKAQTEVFTKDNQSADVNFELVWSIEPKKVGVLLTEVGDEEAIERTRVRNNFLGALKDAFGKQDADSVIQNRDKVATIALAEVRKKFSELGIVAHTLNLSNIEFKPDYQRAVEQKMVEKQRADKAVYETVRIKEEAKQTIETAKADAEAIKIKSAALAQNKGLIQLELAKRWDGKLPQMMLGNSTPLLNLEKFKNE